MVSPPARFPIVKSLSGQDSILSGQGPRKHLLIFLCLLVDGLSCLARPPSCQQQAPPVICLCPVQLKHGPDRCLLPKGCTDTYLSAKMEGHDRIILSMQDEQRAGDVLHAVEGERTRPRSQGDGWGLLVPGPTLGRDLGLGSISPCCLTALILLGFFLLKN